MAQRNYLVGDVRYLYLSSGGFCYYPKCAEPVLREIDDEMVSQVEIAHVHALEKGGSRHEEDMTVEQLNSHRNLILLCAAHHKVVDRKSNESRFPASLLFTWKREREGSKLDALRGIARLTQDQFEQMLVDSTASAKDELLEAIDSLPDRIDERIIKTLRKMAEQAFTYPQLDLDAIDTLGNATRTLASMGFAETVGGFSGAVDRFERAVMRLPEY